jgi:hypothetical protein
MCTGRGDCLHQTGYLDEDGQDIYEQDECSFKCQPQKCPRCFHKLPQWVKDCNKGYCPNCAVDLYWIYSHNKKTFKEGYLKFMKCMESYYKALYNDINNLKYADEIRLLEPEEPEEPEEE